TNVSKARTNVAKKSTKKSSEKILTCITPMVNKPDMLKLRSGDKFITTPRVEKSKVVILPPSEEDKPKIISTKKPNWVYYRSNPRLSVLETPKDTKPYVLITKGNKPYVSIKKGNKPHVPITNGNKPYVLIKKGIKPQVPKSKIPYVLITKVNKPYII